MIGIAKKGKGKPMKLINADALKQDVLALPNCDNGFSDTYDKSLIIGLIDEQDAVLIVRCKDCRYKPIEKNYTCVAKKKDGTVRTTWVETIIESPINPSPCPCINQDDKYYSWVPNDDWYCKEGKLK